MEVTYPTATEHLKHAIKIVWEQLENADASLRSVYMNNLRMLREKANNTLIDATLAGYFEPAHQLILEANDIWNKATQLDEKSTQSENEVKKQKEEEAKLKKGPQAVRQREGDEPGPTDSRAITVPSANQIIKGRKRKRVYKDKQHHDLQSNLVVYMAPEQQKMHSQEMIDERNKIRRKNFVSSVRAGVLSPCIKNGTFVPGLVTFPYQWDSFARRTFQTMAEFYNTMREICNWVYSYLDSHLSFVHAHDIRCLINLVIYQFPAFSQIYDEMKFLHDQDRSKQKQNETTEEDNSQDNPTGLKRSGSHFGHASVFNWMEAITTQRKIATDRKRKLAGVYNYVRPNNCLLKNKLKKNNGDNSTNGGASIEDDDTIIDLINVNEESDSNH